MNKYIGIGFLGSNPEEIKNGCKLSLAIEFWTGKQHKTIWLKVFVFGQSSQNCLNHLEAGRRVLVEGRIDISQGGNTVIVTDNVTFL